MTGKKRLTRYVWPTILILSLVIIGFSVFFMFLTQTIYNVTLERTGSSLTWQSLDENSVAAISFIINRANWDEIWFGLLGVFCAWGLKKKEKFAWSLGVFWSVMLLGSGIIIGVNELYVLGWSEVCLQTYDFIIVGSISLVILLLTREDFRK